MAKKGKGAFYFLIGIPGSGKSTWAREQAERTDAVVICPDCIRVDRRVRSEKAFEIARQEIARHLQAGQEIIFDATNTIRRWRTDNILAGKPFASKVVAVVLDTPLELCLKRHRCRMKKGERVDLPEGVIRRMAEQLADNPPMPEEGFDEIRYIRPASGEKQ